MFLVDWTVKMRIRPPEFETSICDAKYHVSLPPLLSPTSRRRRRPPCAAAAAARRRRKFVSGQFDEENPFVLISSVLIVQAEEGVSFLVVDRIGDIYRNLPRRADVIVTTVGARHKCQQDRKTKIQETTTRPPPRVAALAAARFRSHVGRHLAHWLCMVAEALAVPRARRCAVRSVLVDRLRAKEGGRSCTSCAIAGRRLARVITHRRRPALRHERCCRWPPGAR
ncbi:hypothetical protein F511_32275 [Dorcoceras hygrometricum]|uniref:Uncharacterized protein n=1 Tax=Dorcoceras hygrometricum TaxID=472368 RepID=A0A2Z7CM98_9LAMI|nr:hypothetical protein F511_32275 [Dorcoceras hygrometricum]